MNNGNDGLAVPFLIYDALHDRFSFPIDTVTAEYGLKLVSCIIFDTQAGRTPHL